MFDRYALVLVTLNYDLTDEGGHQFPERGYIEAKDYQRNSDILNGLHGILWGNITDRGYLNCCDSARWGVARVELNDELFYLDKVANCVKFRCAKIVHLAAEGEGERSCDEFFADRKDDPVCISSQRSGLIIRSPYETIPTRTVA